MLKSSDLFHLAFYQKSPYTGSMNGMRYYIEKASGQDADIFRVWIFPGPFSFENTADELKESQTFSFTEESIPAIAEWLNGQYEQRKAYWNRHQSLLSDLA